jgi:aryl-alcohol dehydrogenase-like predicted oxidoreductase
MHRRDVLRLLGLAAAATTAGAGFAARPPPALRMRRIPGSGEEIPVVGLGTWQTFDVGPGREARGPLRDVLRAFAAAGGRLVDSSPMYGWAEEVVGDLAAELGVRPRLFLATKVWTSGRASGIEQMETSARRLRARVVDLLQVHNLVDAATHLDTLQDWKRAGRVRYVGLTHYSAAAHEGVARLLATRPVDFVQINYSVAERAAERRVLPLAAERGVAVIANRPFAAGDLFRRLRARPLPSFAAEIDCTSWAQLLLKFVLSHPAVTCAIPATSKVAHLEDNLGAARGRLPDAKLRDRIAEIVG